MHRFLQGKFNNVKCINVAGYSFPSHLVNANQRSHFLSSQQSGWVLKVLMLYLTSFQVDIDMMMNIVSLTENSFSF